MKITLALIVILIASTATAQTTYIPPAYSSTPGYGYQAPAPIIIPSMPSGGIVLPPSYPGGMTTGFANDGSVTTIIPQATGGYLIITTP